MLNTDLHRANTGRKAADKKMTREEFIAMLRGQDQGANVDKRLLIDIYDSILSHPISMNFGYSSAPSVMSSSPSTMSHQNGSSHSNNMELGSSAADMTSENAQFLHDTYKVNFFCLPFFFFPIPFFSLL